MISLVKLLNEILIKEGGNVFKNSEYDAQNILLNNIQPTVNKFVEDLSRLFPSKKLSFKELTNKSNWLGSTGRKSESGDVDLAYSSDNFFVNGKPDTKGWGLDENEFNTILKDIIFDDTLHQNEFQNLFSETNNIMSNNFLGNYIN